VSVPFTTPSPQAGAAHTPPEHTWLTQSAPIAQPKVSAQGEQEGPPQSVSVSEAFFTPSAHVGIAQV
jgi:hypothetical protein